MITRSSLRTLLYPSRLVLLASMVLAAIVLMPRVAWADTISDLYGTTIDKSEFYDYGMEDAADEDTSISTLPLSAQSSSSITPMSFSDEMLYFCKYESSQNYDQGLSWGDGYHAMGYFQFDNRYGLGSFLEAVYEYDPDTFGYALAGVGSTYGWDVSGTTYADGSLTQLGEDLNWVWHTAYAANPTLFSQLQNGWAYQQYYSGSTGVRASLAAMGIDLDSRPDCIKGLCWGMTNLFGQGGGVWAINNGHYWGANWFFKNSGINDSMSDTELVTTLCDYVVNNVAARYSSQPDYWEGWENRYRNELNDCLGFLSLSVDDKESATWMRLWGQNQLDTMQAISQNGFSSSSSIVIATEETYWDALSSNSLAGLLDAPVLLTDRTSLPAQTVAEIERLGASTAYVVGGPTAISEEVETQLVSAGCTTIKRVYGDDQQDTAREVAMQLGSSGSSTCIIATSNGFQDALSASSYAYAKKVPILLTESGNNALSSETLSLIESAGYSKVVIVGGTLAVSSSVENQLGSIGLSGSSVSRIWGQTEYETSTAFASYAIANGMDTSGMGVATAKTYWDALTGAALCGKNNAILILADDTNHIAACELISAQSGSVLSGYVFGGKLAVSARTWNALVGVIG